MPCDVGEFMSRVKLTIQYVGTDFCGWQSQKNGVSVQDTVEQALATYFDCPPFRIHAAGRTDVGVHARGQVAHFDTKQTVNTFKLCLGVNLALPKSVAVTSAELVDDTFDARFSAISKTYCYRIYVSPTRKPLWDVDHLQVYKPLDVEKMREAAAMLVGTHDFAAFQKNGSNLKGTVRTVNSFDIVQNDSVIQFWINGNAFLYNQVRNMCGLLLEIGRGKFEVSAAKQMLDGQKIRFRTLPPHGLTLEEVRYKSWFSSEREFALAKGGGVL